MALSDDEKEEVRVIIAEELAAFKLVTPLTRSAGIEDAATRAAVANLEQYLANMVRKF